MIFLDVLYRDIDPTEDFFSRSRGCICHAMLNRTCELHLLAVVGLLTYLTLLIIGYVNLQLAIQAT